MAGQSIGSLNIQLSVDSSRLDRDLSTAYAMAVKDAERMEKALGGRNADLYRRAQQVELSTRSETSRRIDQLNELDEMRRRGLLSRDAHAKATAQVQAQGGRGGMDKLWDDIDRKTVRRFGHVPEAVIGLVKTAQQKGMEGIGTEVQDVSGTVTNVASGIVSTFQKLGGPVAGAIVGVVGGAITSLIELIENAVNRAAKASLKIVDAVAAGQLTVRQGFARARQEDIDYAERQFRSLGGGAVGYMAAADEGLRRSLQSQHDERLRAIEEGRGDVEGHNREQAFGASRGLIQSNATIRARSQADELSRTLNETAARESMGADAAQRLALAQDFAAHSGLSLREAQGRLAEQLENVERAQTAAAAAAARDQILSSARSFLVQASALGASAEAAESARRRFAALQEIMARTGMTRERAMRELGPRLAQEDASAAAAAAAGLQGRMRDMVRQNFVQESTFVGFERSVEGTAGPGQVATTTQESVARQQQMAQMDLERERVQEQARLADIVAEQQNRELERRRRSAQTAADTFRRGGGAFADDRTRAEAQVAALDRQLEANRALGEERRRQLDLGRRLVDTDRVRLVAQDVILRQLELQRNAMAEGNQLRLQLRSPLEQFSDELARLDNLRSRGGIDDLTHGRAVMAAQDRLLATDQQSTGPTASLSQGSAAALNAINAYRRPVESREERLQRVMEQQRQLQQELLQVQQRQLALLAGGRVLAALRPGGL